MTRRPDVAITQKRIDEISTIKGHLIPVFTQEAMPGREAIAELRPEDFHKVVQGYACGNAECLADFGGIFRLECPVCHKATSMDNRVVEPPPIWAEHRAARENAPATPKLPRGPVAPEDFLARVAGDREVDQTSLSKLKKRAR